MTRSLAGAGRRGLTLVEVMIAMLVGVVVIGATMNFTVNTFRGWRRPRSGRTCSGAGASSARRWSGICP